MTPAATTMEGKLCVVTGATAGIGKGTCLGLARLGATVVMVSRNAQRGEAVRAELVTASGNAKISVELADMADQRAVRALAARLIAAHPVIDVLVHSAGAMFYERGLTVDGVERNFAVNYLGAFLLTQQLRAHLVASGPARIVCVSGDYHRKARLDFDDLQLERRFHPLRAAARATLAKATFSSEMARRLVGTEVTCNALHPGAVRSELTRDLPLPLRVLAALGRPFMRSIERGAETPVFLASSPSVAGVSGKYFVDCRAVPAAAAAVDPANGAALWARSEALVAASAQSSKQ